MTGRGRGEASGLVPRRFSPPARYPRDVTGSDDAAITLTDRADGLLASLLDDEGLDPSTAGLRIAVERGGCAGLSYRFDLTGAPGDGDLVRDRDGVRLFVAAAAQEYVAGAEIDVTESAHGTGLRIDNPNADQQCGCGLSFR